MEDWTCLGQHKRQPEFPVVTRESRRNSRKTTWLPRHRKMKPFPATALLGVNGAGKTTCLRLLATIIKPTTGTALVAGHDVPAEPESVRHKVGFLSTSTALYGRLTAAEFVTY